MSKVKLIATDMDGTFLNHAGTYDKERFGAILKGLKTQGITFAVASGRSYLSLEKLFADFKDELIFIAENGSLVLEKDQSHFEALMTKDFYLSVLKSLKESPFGRDSAWLLSGRRASYVLKTADQAYVDHIKKYYDNVTLVEDFSQVEDDIFKITGDLGEDKVVEGAAWLSQNLPGVKTMATGFTSIDIIRDDVDKRTGLEKLCRDLDIRSEEVMVFGDNLNDYQMMDYAGFSIATTNARDEIKALANLVIGTCDQEAVQAYLEEFLCEQ